MNKLILFTLMLYSVILFSSCSSSDSKSISTSKSLTKTKWVLRELNGTKIFTPESGKDAFLILDSGSDKTNGSGGCNNFFTSYTVSGKTLKFGLVASTEMFCQNVMDTESGFFKALEKTQSYRIKGNYLYLSDSTGEIAKLEAQELNNGPK